MQMMCVLMEKITCIIKLKVQICKLNNNKSMVKCVIWENYKEHCIIITCITLYLYLYKSKWSFITWYTLILMIGQVHNEFLLYNLARILFSIVLIWIRFCQVRQTLLKLTIRYWYAHWKAAQWHLVAYIPVILMLVNHFVNRSAIVQFHMSLFLY